MKVIRVTPEQSSESGVVVLKGAWTASSSAAMGTRLTESITLTAGTWIIVGQNPKANSSILLAFEGISDFKYNSTNVNSGAYIITIPSGETLTTYMKAGQADSRTFTTLTDGHIQAIKVA